MIGLRKVVNLRIYDIPKRTTVVHKVKSEKNTFRYTWRNTYYIGNTKIHKSRRFNNTFKKPKFVEECDDEYLRTLVDEITKSDETLEEKLNENKDYICYENNDSLIYYFGDHIETLKNKVLLKSRKK